MIARLLRRADEVATTHPVRFQTIKSVAATAVCWRSCYLFRGQSDIHWATLAVCYRPDSIQATRAEATDAVSLQAYPVFEHVTVKA